MSWGSGRGFHAEFEHTATSDPTSYLAAPEGIALLREWGFEAVLATCTASPWEAGRMLTDRWEHDARHRRTTWSARWSPCRCRSDAGTTTADATRLRLALLVDDRIEVQLHAWRGRLWARVSAQVYNDRSDIVRLADAVRASVRAGTIAPA